MKGQTEGILSRPPVPTMLLRLRLLFGSVATGSLLFLLLCLGAQNLDDRISLQLGIGRSAPLPSGFVIGLAVVLGVIGGGGSTALLWPLPEDEQS